MRLRGPRRREVPKASRTQQEHPRREDAWAWLPSWSALMVEVAVTDWAHLYRRPKVTGQVVPQKSHNRCHWLVWTEGRARSLDLRDLGGN